MRTYTAASLAFLPLLIGCEQTNDLDEIPYKERLVVSADLNASGSSAGVRLWRTMRFQETFADSTTSLSDANVWITTPDTVFALDLRREGWYINYDMRGHLIPGSEYRLDVEWHGRRAWAVTRIPVGPDMDTVIITHNTALPEQPPMVHVVLTPRAGEVLFASVEAHAGSHYRSWKEQGPLRPGDAAGDGKLHLSFQLQPVSTELDSVWVSTSSFDAPYYDYYISRGDIDYRGPPGASYFTGPVRWNVHGDGVGLFMGRNQSSRVIYPR
jgi:hypothetical protein